MHSTHCSSDHSKVVKWEIGGVWAELDRRGTPFPLHQYCTNGSLANVPLCGWNAIVRYENLDAVCGRKLATGDDSYQLDFWNIYLWILNQQWHKNSNQPELWPGKWAMERQYGAPVAYRERQVMATLSWHKIGGHVTDRGWILNDKLTFILDQSKPYYWMIIQRWIQSRGRWRPLWHCLHWPVVGR